MDTNETKLFDAKNVSFKPKSENDHLTFYGKKTHKISKLLHYKTSMHAPTDFELYKHICFIILIYTYLRLNGNHRLDNEGA